MREPEKRPNTAAAAPKSASVQHHTSIAAALFSGSDITLLFSLYFVLWMLPFMSKKFPFVLI